MKRVLKTRNDGAYFTVLIIYLLILFAAVSTFAGEKPTGDPKTDPIPSLDFDTNEKTIVVNLYFFDSSTVSANSIEVIMGLAAGNVGAPPHLSSRLLDIEGNLIDQFYAWNPLLYSYYDSNGFDHVRLLPEGEGTIFFSFNSEVAMLEISDVEKDELLVSVDLVPSIHAYCRDNRSDPDCANIANRLPVCNAGGPYTVECLGAATRLTLNGTESRDPDEDSLEYLWTGTFSEESIGGVSPSVEFSGTGNFKVSLAVSDEFDGVSTCNSQVSVIDTIPPVIEITASPDVLWPPNHKLVKITPTVRVTDSCDEAPQITLKTITMDEGDETNTYDPAYDDTLGDGHTLADIQVDAEGNIFLRAERSGTGDGRVYTLTYEASDASGNSTTATATVTVPHDMD